VGQFENSLERNEVVGITSAASEVVSDVGPGQWDQARSRFMIDPTTGALVVRPDAYREIDKAMFRLIRRMKRDLYFFRARLYVEKFFLQGRRISLKAKNLLLGLTH
jgi:hypothetical protein